MSDPYVKILTSLCHSVSHEDTTQRDLSYGGTWYRLCIWWTISQIHETAHNFWECQLAVNIMLKTRIAKILAGNLFYTVNSVCYIVSNQIVKHRRWIFEWKSTMPFENEYKRQIQFTSVHELPMLLCMSIWILTVFVRTPMIAVSCHLVTAPLKRYFVSGDYASLHFFRDSGHGSIGTSSMCILNRVHPLDH